VIPADDRQCAAAKPAAPTGATTDNNSVIDDYFSYTGPKGTKAALQKKYGLPTVTIIPGARDFNKTTGTSQGQGSKWTTVPPGRMVGRVAPVPA